MLSTIIVTRPIAPSRDEGHFEGVLEQIDNDPQHVYIQPLVPGAPKPPYHRHGPGAHTYSVPLSEIRAIRPL